ncbi:MAG: NUDIX hydrolase [Pseudomonadota bacterium]
MADHRQRLLSALDSYLERYPEEQPVAERISALVTAHADCFERTCYPGHITGSAWIVNRSATHALLTHHKKLGRWLQLGGHSDGDGDTAAVARREGEEESGLALELLMPQVFDIDVHMIPARGVEPAHEHHDLRFLFRADTDRGFTVSEESHALAWVPLDELHRYTDERSVLRLAHKFRRFDG